MLNILRKFFTGDKAIRRLDQMVRALSEKPHHPYFLYRYRAAAGDIEAWDCRDRMFVIRRADLGLSPEGVERVMQDLTAEGLAYRTKAEKAEKMVCKSLPEDVRQKIIEALCA
jgi:hypothetical protein